MTLFFHGKKCLPHKILQSVNALYLILKEYSLEQPPMNITWSEF